MSSIINTKKILIARDCIVGKKCDICGKEILPTDVLHKYGEPVYDYYEVTTYHNHNNRKNDSVDSYKYFNVCSPDCVNKLWEEYIRDSMGSINTKYIKVEHVNCWTRKDTEVSDDA